MANNSTDIRNLMNLLESAQQQDPTLLEGWVDNLKNKIHGHLGNKERIQMAKKLASEWSAWLGQTKRKGTLNDMKRFMKIRIGFKDEDVSIVLKNVNLDADADAPEATAAEPDNTQPVKQGIKRANPDAKSPGKDDAEEEGTPLPDDLNTKLSDYKNLKPGETPPGQKADDASAPAPEGKKYKVYQENPKAYMDGNTWDEKKINQRKAKLKPGEELQLGDRKIRIPFLGDAASGEFVDPRAGLGDDEDEANESINEADVNQGTGAPKADAEEDSIDPETTVLKPDEVHEIMDASAAQINDQYLLNGPDNDKAELAAQQAMSMHGRGARNSFRVPGASKLDAVLGQNAGAKKGSGQYDTKEMLDVLGAVNYDKNRVPSLERKVGKATSIGEMSDQDMQELALIGFAFLRSRT